jgi:hypothetical protein
MTDEAEPKNKLIVELFDIIAEQSDNPDVIREITVWAFSNNKGLSLLPALIHSIIEYGSDNDLKRILTALDDNYDNWLNKLPAEDITTVMTTLINKAASSELSDEFSNLIADVLSMQPLEAVDILNEKVDSDNMVVMIKKMFFHLVDC